MMRTSILIALLAVATAAPARADDAPPPSPAPAATATAEPAAPWSIGLAPRLGLVLPTSKLGAMMVGGLELDVALPVADHKLVLALDGSLTRPTHDGTVMDPRLPGPATYTIGETELAVALDLDYRFAGSDAHVVPWIGAGPMLHMLRTTESTSIAPGDNTAQSTEFGVQVAGGVDLKAGPGYVAGDVRYAYSKLDHTLTGSTNAGKITIAIAYRLVF